MNTENALRLVIGFDAEGQPVETHARSLDRDLAATLANVWLMNDKRIATVEVHLVQMENGLGQQRDPEHRATLPWIA